MSVAVAYLRVSTEKQEVDAQRRAIEEFAKTRSFTVLWFTDEAVSGGVKAFERPGFKRMIEFLESNPHVKDIVVFELSRLGRDYDDLKDVLHYIGSKGYRLWIVTLPTWNELMESVKTIENPLVKLLYKLLADIFVSVMAFSANQERVLISMRTRAGLERARAEGKKLGRPGYPFPVDEVRQLLKKGLPLTRIHRLLVAEGRVCREVKGKGVDCMKYETFRRKVKEIKKAR
ncbi:MAG: recombinase family protein [Thermosphaera sp.]